MAGKDDVFNTNESNAPDGLTASDVAGLSDADLAAASGGSWDGGLRDDQYVCAACGAEYRNSATWPLCPDCFKASRSS